MAQTPGQIIGEFLRKQAKRDVRLHDFFENPLDTDDVNELISEFTGEPVSEFFLDPREDY